MSNVRRHPLELVLQSHRSKATAGENFRAQSESQRTWENFMDTHGYPHETWERAKSEGKTILAARAKRGKTIAYSEFVNQLTTVRLEPRDIRLAHLLGDISVEEDSAGRGMLTVLVVHKSGDLKPGPGFFDLATRLGRDTSDELACWVEEFRSVVAAWKSAT